MAKANRLSISGFIGEVCSFGRGGQDLRASRSLLYYGFGVRKGYEPVRTGYHPGPVGSGLAVGSHLLVWLGLSGAGLDGQGQAVSACLPLKSHFPWLPLRIGLSKPFQGTEAQCAAPPGANFPDEPELERGSLSDALLELARQLLPTPGLTITFVSNLATPKATRQSPPQMHHERTDHRGWRVVWSAAAGVMICLAALRWGVAVCLADSGTQSFVISR